MFFSQCVCCSKAQKIPHPYVSLFGITNKEAMVRIQSIKMLCIIGWALTCQLETYVEHCVHVGVLCNVGMWTSIDITILS
jgi:hypothetical protein